MNKKVKLLTKSDQLKVIGVAIRIGGMVCSMEKPYRHSSIIHRFFFLGLKGVSKGEQGFLLSNGKFANRIEAAEVALESKQISKLKWPPYLYSEDLWTNEKSKV